MAEATRIDAPSINQSKITMNRQKLACDLITELARLIVGHPTKLQSRVCEAGGGLVLFLKPANSDFGRLIGKAAVIHEALNALGGEIALSGFELMDIEEPTIVAPKILFKPWNQSNVEGLLRRILDAVFTKDYTLQWSDQKTAILINIEVGNGFESERVSRIAEKLKVLFHAAARMHGRNIRIWLDEAKEAV